MRHLVLALAVSTFAACGPSGDPTGIENVTCPPESTLTYENFGRDLIDTKCLECHDGDERPNLATQAAIIRNKDEILDLAVYTDAMPEEEDMPLAERELLGEWIACGAP